MKLLLLALSLAAWAQAGKFYADDPLEAEPPPRDASKAIRRKISDYYDFFLQTFDKPGERVTKTTPSAARAVNTLGEPMESNWWTRRHYYKPMSIDDLAKGPGNTSAPSMDGKWTVVKAKAEGVTPGFEFLDSKKRRYVLKFDPLTYPELATGPDVLVSKFFYALGYNVPENYVVYFDRDQLELGPDVELLDRTGKPRKMTDRDVTELLLATPKDKQGRYRGGASLFLSGKPIGPFKYFGTRRDDPNDVVPHEHRRDLRGLRVFCAWLGHDDSRAINTLDMLVKRGEVSFPLHHLIDFGSTLGSASYGPNSPRSGFEYVFSWAPIAKEFFSLGLAVPYWARAHYPNNRAVGRFEAARFDAAKWVPEYPNPAFENMLPEDAFWAAKQVMAFRDEEIRAIVQTGQYSNPGSVQWIADALIKRRDKVGKAFLNVVLPLDKFRVADGTLGFDDLGVKHGLAPTRQYRFEWFGFDNGSGQRTAVGGIGTARIPGVETEYLVCDIRAGNEVKFVSVYLRREAGSYKVVGLERR